MAIYRGSGGSGSSTQDSYLNEVTAQAIIATTAANSTAGSAAATAADVLLTNADAVSTAADVLLTAADVLLTAADAEATAADVLLTNADVAATADKLPKSGGALTGPVTTNSTFDGRDVATDGTKLDTVEASADVTDATNVTAAGALMDSEVTNLADVKAFDTTDYATATQGTTADNALSKSGGTMTGDLTVPNLTATSVVSDSSGNVRAGRKNLIINGGFDVWQRGTSGFGHDSFNADRWVEFTNTDDTYSVQKVNLNASDMAATGQSKALKVTTTAGTTGNLNDLRQKVEFPERLYNKTLTLSFWYKSDSTATINNVRVGSIINSVSVAHLSSQTINATTIWQKASFTFTCSGMGVGTLTANDHLEVIVSSPVGTTTTYYITGVQLELGSEATDFEHRSYGEELALCQRYYQDVCSSQATTPVLNIATYNATTSFGVFTFPLEMRTAPTLYVPNPTLFGVYAGGAGYTTTGISGGVVSRKNIELAVSVTGHTTGYASFMRTTSGLSSIQLDAEL